MKAQESLKVSKFRNDLRLQIRQARLDGRRVEEKALLEKLKREITLGDARRLREELLLEIGEKLKVLSDSRLRQILKFAVRLSNMRKSDE